jgi:hypothetical protein
MDSRHKNKAVIGLIIWSIATIGSSALFLYARLHHHTHENPGHTAKVLLWAFFMAIQCVAYFWGATHLARAKGYSNAIIILGIFPPAQLVVYALLLFAMPDRCSHQSGFRPKSRHSLRHAPN